MSAEFDSFKDSYVEDLDDAVGFSGKSGEFFTARKADLIVELAAARIGNPLDLDLLDVGCGIGQTDRFLTGRLGSLSGTDVSLASLERARGTNPGVDYTASEEGAPLPYGDGSFDLTFAICVMHHVDEIAHPGFLAEMRRVTRQGGIVAIFEHNPWNPGTRKAVHDCPFDVGVKLIRERRMKRLFAAAGLKIVESRQIIFLPTASPWWLRIEDRIGWLPLGAQYFTAGRREA